MENNGREQWDPTFLLQWENLYVYLGIFHGLIAKKPIPGPSVQYESCCSSGAAQYHTLGRFSSVLLL